VASFMFHPFPPSYWNDSGICCIWFLTSDINIKLSVIGTPAEEGKCGKSYMIAAGVFDDVDVAMMAHPSQFTLPKPLMVAMTP